MKLKKMLALVLSFIFILNIASVGVKDVNAAGDMKAQVLNDSNTIINMLLSNPADSGKISNVVINTASANNRQVGSFTGGTGVLDFDTGIAMSTGGLLRSVNWDGKPSSNSYSTIKSTVISGKNTSKSVKISGETLNDPCSIEFDVNMDNAGTMSFQYAFGSEEYTSYSDPESKFNDKFYILVDGDTKANNIAKIPGTNTDIAIRSINQSVHTEFFRQNVDDNGIKSLRLKTPLNGVTKTFTAKAELTAGPHHVKIIIGDYYDAQYDSVLFVKAGSLKFVAPKYGELSVVKENGKVVIKRANGTDGTVAFTLEETNLLGEKAEFIYTIPDGVDKLVLPIMAENESDTPNKIAYDTSKVVIKDGQMGVSISATDTLTLKIEAPEITKNADNSGFTIKGRQGATVEIYKKDGTLAGTTTLDGSGNGSFTGNPASYYVTQTSGVITSDKSNIVKLVKPPVINVTNTNKVYIAVNISGTQTPYPPPAATAVVFEGEKPLTLGTEAFRVENPLKTDTNVPGIYTVKWTATNDDGLVAIASKEVEVRPEVPLLFNKNYKQSELIVKGEIGAKVEIRDKNNKLVATLELEADPNNPGKGIAKLLDPPNGDFTAVQIINGAHSEAANEVNINRTFTVPVITLIGSGDIEMTYGEAYTEAGATVADTEDDAVGSNVVLEERMIIEENPMYNENGKISITNPAFNADGSPKAANASAFTPFIGKYIIKYKVTDTDDMDGHKQRHVKVLPPKPSLSVPATNANSEIDIDAVSTASVFLFKKDGSGNFTEYKPSGNIIWTKMATGSGKFDLDVSDKFTGLPDGEYKVKQKLFGLLSGFSNPVTVTHEDHAPVITLAGDKLVKIEKNKTYTEAGATYTVDNNPMGANRYFWDCKYF